MKTRLTAGVLLASLLTICARSYGAALVVNSDQMSNRVAVRNVTTGPDGTVSGILVNRSDAPVRDVELVVSHQFLWRHEFRPGADDPSRADYTTVQGEIPPGGQMTFSFRPTTPLPDRRDGRFQTDVEVASVTQIDRSTPQPATSTTN
jgi:hypothetical protein